MTIKPPPGRVFVLIGKFFSKSWLEWFDTFRNEWNTFYATVTGLTASLLVSTDASGDLSSVGDLTDWIDRSSDITITDDGDGTLTVGRNMPDTGSLHAHDIAADKTLALVNTWYQITQFTTQGNLTVNVDASVAQSHIQIAGSGTQFFLVSFSFSGHGHQVHDYDLHIKVNNGVTDYDQIAAHFSTPTAGRVLSVASSDIISLNEDDTVELWIQRTTAGNNIVVTIDTVVMHVLKIAGF